MDSLKKYLDGDMVFGFTKKIFELDWVFWIHEKNIRMGFTEKIFEWGLL